MSDLYIYLMMSRNKDNKNITNFTERCKKFLEYEDKEDNIRRLFEKFAKDGLPGEKTRLYKSVNPRDEEKSREDLIIRLLKHKPSIANLSNLSVSVSQQKENRADSKWLFDFDIKDQELALQFLSDVRTYSNTFPILHKTPNGFAIVVDHGFDVRELMKKWNDYDIILKKDGLLFLDIIENGVNYE